MERPNRQTAPRRETLTPAERSLRGRIGAYRLHATHDPRETTLPARTAFLARFLDEQPAELPEAERLRRAEAARRAYMARLAYASARSRRRHAAVVDAACAQPVTAPGRRPPTPEAA